jgi:hypothetical protein
MGMTEELRVGPAFRLVKALELMFGDREYFIGIVGSLHSGGGLIR